MKPSDYFSIKFVPKDSSGDNDKLIFLDQTKLPLQEKYIETDDYNLIAEAIGRLEARADDQVLGHAGQPVGLDSQQVAPRFEAGGQVPAQGELVLLGSGVEGGSS